MSKDKAPVTPPPSAAEEMAPKDPPAPNQDNLEIEQVDAKKGSEKKGAFAAPKTEEEPTQPQPQSDEPQKQPGDTQPKQFTAPHVKDSEYNLGGRSMASVSPRQ